MLKQVGALPVRRTEDGRLEVLLVSSRETGRWVIPKGWTSKKLTDSKAAAREAREEAGISGEISAASIGQYVYRKATATGLRMVQVNVHLMRVTRTRKKWPEKLQRVRCWFDLDTASRKVREPRLKKIIRSLDKRAPRT